MNDALWSIVRERAGNRCEYCRLHQDNDPFYTYPVDHIIARQHGGQTVDTNPALSCFRCNSFKGPNMPALIPALVRCSRCFTRVETDGGDHFEWNGPLLFGSTPIGRATVELLQMNHPDAVLLRDSLIDEGILPLS